VTRTQKAKLNVATSLFAQVVTMVCGLILPRLLIGAFGSVQYGATTSIAHFIAYISLIEGGIGGVARAALYKPVAEGDNRTLSQVYYEIIRFFRGVGLIFLVYTAVLACGYKYIVSNSELEWLFSFALVIVISISTFGQYFIGLPNSILVQADQRQYVNNIISIVTLILNTLLSVVFIRLGCGIIIVKLVSSCVFLMRPLILALYVRRRFTIIDRHECEKTKLLTQKRTAMGQHIAYFLHSNTDVVILTLLVNLRMVSVYSVHYMVASSIRGITSSFYNGLESVLGNMYAKKEHDKLLRTFSIYETLISCVSITMFSTAAALIVPFVKVYTAGIEDAECYVIPVFALVIVLAEMVYTLRSPYHYMVNAAYRFRQTRAAAYGEAVINIVLSVALVLKFGITGVAVATLVATIFRWVYYAVYLSKHVMHRPFAIFVKRTVINCAAFAVIYLLANLVLGMVEIKSYLVLVLCGAGTFAAAAVITLIMNILFYRNDISASLNILLHRRTKKA